MSTRFSHAALKRARLELGMSQEDAAQQLGIDVRTYRRYESGAVNGPRGFLIHRADRRQLIHGMSELFGLDEAELVVRPSAREVGGWPVRWEHQLQPARNFVGRETLMSELRAWTEAPEPPVRLTALVAVGGTGKSAICERLVRSLDARRRAGGVFVWSYYSSERTELMLERLHRYLGGPAGAPSPGERLSQVLERLDGSAPHLLVLDGLEVVQSEGDRERAFGELTDPTLRRLLEHVAGGVGAARALVTSRFPLPDLEGWEERSVRTVRLPPLTAPESRALLDAAGLSSRPDADRIVQLYGGHPLSLAMVANYLVKFARGRAGHPIVDLEEAGADVPLARRLSRVLHQCARMLPEDETKCLRILCTFPRDMEVDDLSRLAGRLVSARLSDREVRRAIGRLLERDLVYEVSASAVSAHSFVREHFADPALAREPFRTPALDEDATGPMADGTPVVGRGRYGRPADRKDATLELSPRVRSDPTDLADLEALFERSVSAGLGRVAFGLYQLRFGGYPRLGLVLGEMALGERLMRRLATASAPPRGRPSLGLSPLERSDVVYEWGLYAAALGDLERARRCHEAHCEMATELSSEVQTMGLRTLAYNQRLRGDLEAALQTIQASWNAACEAESAHHQHLALGLRAAIHHARGELDLAAQVFETLRGLGALPKARRGIWEAELWLDVGDRDRVLEIARANLELCSAYGWGSHEAQCHIVLGRALLPEDPEAASEHWRRARPWWVKTGEVEVILQAHELAAEIALAAHDDPGALEEIDAGVRLAESASAELYRRRLEKLRPAPS